MLLTENCAVPTLTCLDNCLVGDLLRGSGSWRDSGSQLRRQLAQILIGLVQVLRLLGTGLLGFAARGRVQNVLVRGQYF